MRSLLLLTLLAGNVAAQDTTYAFTVSPDPPIANQEFQIHVAMSPPSCVILPDAMTVTSFPGNVIRYEVHVPDFCSLPLPPQERTYTLPALPPGAYTFRFAVCTSAIPPLEPCSIVGEQAALIVGSGASLPPSAIPSLSSWGLAVLAGIAVLFGLAVLRYTALSRSTG